MNILIGAISEIEPASAGNTLNWINWVKGLQLLGHKVTFIEQFNAPTAQEVGSKTLNQTSTKAIKIKKVMKELDLDIDYCMLSGDASIAIGLTLEQLENRARNADLLINFSGSVTADVVMQNAGCRAYLDTDPVYTQLWHTEYKIDIGLDKHNKFITVGSNIGTHLSPIPNCGFSWFPAGRPMVLHDFHASSTGGQTLSTVAAWKVFGDLYFQNEWYYSKAHEIERFISLPRKTPQPLEIVLREDWGEHHVLQRLRDHGWSVIEASQRQGIPSYIDYISSSRADLGIAKHAYVKAYSGWFSDRAAHYLACGRPVLHQSTGFERTYPTGSGLISFYDENSLLSSIETLNSCYDMHCRDAREFASEFLDYRKVIPPILEHCVGS